MIYMKKVPKMQWVQVGQKLFVSFPPCITVHILSLGLTITPRCSSSATFWIYHAVDIFVRRQSSWATCRHPIPSLMSVIVYNIIYRLIVGWPGLGRRRRFIVSCVSTRTMFENFFRDLWIINDYGKKGESEKNVQVCGTSRQA